MKKIDGLSYDVLEDNINELKRVFPQVFCGDGKIDGEMLLTLLGERVEADNEKYSFSWKGKSDALRLAQKRSTGTLRPCVTESKDFESTGNLYIEGDNLEVLKLLQASYLNSVKMIYIDPPYNTGNDFVYEDDFADGIENYKKITGQAQKSNPETAGRYHTNWLNMMLPRLKLARNLLSDDGVIFISIDDNEQANLKKLCDEVFGEDNFVAVFTWRRRSGANDAKNNVSLDHEYVICYSKTVNFQLFGEVKTFESYTNPDNDPRGEWARDNLTCGKTASQRPNLFYPITDPKTGISYECNPNHVWRFEKSRMAELIKENKIIFPTGKGLPTYKRHKAEVRSETKPFSSIIETRLNSVGTKEVREIFDGQVFDYPKTVDLIKQLIFQATEPDSLILDFFSGSATTAHAVMQLNAEDNGNRKFICVQLPEVTDSNSEAFKAGYKNICEIGKERIRRAGEKIKAESPLTTANLDVGFKVLKLDSSNLVKWNNAPTKEAADIERRMTEWLNHLVGGRTDLDLVFEIMLKYGLPLTLTLAERTFSGVPVHIIEHPDYRVLICLQPNVSLEAIEAMDKELIGTYIFAERCFMGSNSLLNAEEIFKRKEKSYGCFNMSKFEIVSLIVTGLGVIATFSAVFVALWQTKIANSKSLKFLTGIVQVSQVCFETFDTKLMVKAMNVGNRKIIIQNWGIIRKGEAAFVILSEDIPWPVTIDIECSYDFYIPFNAFAKMLDNKVSAGELPKNKKIKFFLTSTTGKRYSCKSKKTAAEFIKEGVLV